MKPEETDFAIWERAYGRRLSDLERLEIKSNTLAFLKLLADEALVNRPEYCRGLIAETSSEKRSMSPGGSNEI